MQALHTVPLLPLLLSVSSVGLASSAFADTYHLNAPPPSPSTYAQEFNDQRFEPIIQQDTVPRPSSRDGRDRTIFADGREYDLDLSGRNGASASSSRRRTSLYDVERRLTGEEPQLNRNVSPVHGSSGQPGGDGGTLTVYYTNLTHLRNIYVDASGGRGGAGSSGTDGFSCPPPETDLPEIDINQDLRVIPSEGLPQPPTLPPEAAPPIEPKRLRGDFQGQQTNGNSGSSQFVGNELQALDKAPNAFLEDTIARSVPAGCRRIPARSGSRGRDGRVGQLRIVNREEELPPEKPETNVAVSDLTEQTYDLSKHIWHERSGATELLAPESIIADEYLEFVERREATVQVSWTADQPLNRFETSEATLSLEDDGRVQVDLGDQLWSLSETHQSDDLTKVLITALVPEAEVLELAKGSWQRSQDSLNLAVIDLAGHSEVLTTQFYVRYRAASSDALNNIRPRWETQYEGDVPAELVTRDYNRFSLNLGALPIESQYLQPGTPIAVEIEVTRSLGERSATQTLSWEGEIR